MTAMTRRVQYETNSETLGPMIYHLDLQLCACCLSPWSCRNCPSCAFAGLIRCCVQMTTRRGKGSITALPARCACSIPLTISSSNQHLPHRDIFLPSNTFKTLQFSAFTLQHTSRYPSTFQLSDQDQDEDPRSVQPYPARIHHHHHHHHHYHNDDDDFDHSEGDDYYLFNHDDSYWYPNHYHYFDYESTSYPIHSHDFYHYHSNSPIVASELEERAFKENLRRISRKIKTGLKALNPWRSRPAHSDMRPKSPWDIDPFIGGQDTSAKRKHNRNPSGASALTTATEILRET
ncbi:hypothetical protein ABKN59_010441 [Abortiporus biennis]